VTSGVCFSVLRLATRPGPVGVQPRVKHPFVNSDFPAWVYFLFFDVSLQALRSGCLVSCGIGLIKYGDLFAALRPLFPLFSELLADFWPTSALITAIFN
jgi:hypothetical protein